MKMTSTFALANSLTSHEQEITRLTWLRLYREFADECRWLARFAQTPEQRKLLPQMETAWTKLAEAVGTESIYYRYSSAVASSVLLCPHFRHSAGTLDYPNWAFLREARLARRICMGWSNKEIAKDLNLEEGTGTVKIHLHRIFPKASKTELSLLLR
jgi:hypothetical protein